ncbi:MAG: DUF58 domain-containing protein [bacterium]
MPNSVEPEVLRGAYVDLDQLLALRYKTLPHNPATSSRVVGNRAGLKLSKVKGRGVDFSEVRTYQPGDDIRAIDWRVTARKNKPHTKIFREERERPTLLVVDQSQQMFFGSKIRLKSVACADLAARIAWQNLAAGDRVGGIVISNDRQIVHRPYRTAKAVARLLNDVSQCNQDLQPGTIDSTSSVDEGMLRVRRLTRTNFRIFVLSDFAGDLERWQQHLHQLARHNQVVVVHIYDPLEQHLPPADHYAVTDGQHRLQFYTGDRQLRHKYAQRFADRTAAIEQMCRHDAMSYVGVQTDNTSLDEMVWV